jgi:superfamily II DNA or RNA helicase
MAGLLIKELKIRGLANRTLIVTPANLSFQWQRELKDKFRENFEIIRSDVLRTNYGSNPWQEKNQVITSVSWVSRIDDAKESLLRSHWDLIIVDEAHKMSASSADKKTLAYQLGESLSAMTDHYLLMTATPHKGDPQNFCLFLSLLDKDVYGDVKTLEDAMTRHEAPFYLRRVKEALVSFPDPETGKVKALFTRRIVKTGFHDSGRGTAASAATVVTSCLLSSPICDLDIPATSVRWSSSRHLASHLNRHRQISQCGFGSG